MLQQTQVDRVVPRWQRVARALADGRGARGRVDGRRDRRVAGARLQPARASACTARAARRRNGWPDDLTELPGVGPYTAAAVGNFAFGRDVLPVDTNVRRVQERTGEQFDGACAQALFDLGATICLARIPRCDECPLAERCPRAARATSRCASNRGSRARSGSVARSRCARSQPATQPADDEALASLARDGLVVLATAAARPCPASARR